MPKDFQRRYTKDKEHIFVVVTGISSDDGDYDKYIDAANMLFRRWERTFPEWTLVSDTTECFNGVNKYLIAAFDLQARDADRCIDFRRYDLDCAVSYEAAQEYADRTRRERREADRFFSENPTFFDDLRHLSVAKLETLKRASFHAKHYCENAERFVAELNGVK